MEKTRRQGRQAPLDVAIPASEQPRTLRRREGTSGAVPGPETVAIKPNPTLTSKSPAVDNAPLAAPKRGRPKGNKVVPGK